MSDILGLFERHCDNLKGRGNQRIALCPFHEDTKHSFSIKSKGDYLASDRYSTTLKNEKRLVDYLTNDLTSKIKNRINLVTNDF